MDQPAKDSLWSRLLGRLGLVDIPDSAEELETEIQELIEEGEEQGLITSRQGQMLASIFEFDDTSIKEIMTPATEIIQAPISADPCTIIKLIKQHGFSRIPIYEESPDQLRGFIHAKNLLSCPNEPQQVPGESNPLEPLISPLLFVHGNDKIMGLLQSFQAQSAHMAIVMDEFGAARGLVTLEDILEEIVGEIVDETDKPDTSWQVIDEHTLITDAKVDIDEVEKFFNQQFPEGSYESLGGFILNELGRIPAEGYSLKHQGLTLTILSADQRRINTVKVHQQVNG